MRMKRTILVGIVTTIICSGELIARAGGGSRGGGGRMGGSRLGHAGGNRATARPATGLSRAPRAARPVSRRPAARTIPAARTTRTMHPVQPRNRQGQLRHTYARNRAHHRAYNHRWLNRHFYHSRYPFWAYGPFLAYPWFGFSLAWGWPYYYPGFGMMVGLPLWSLNSYGYYPPYYYRKYITVDTSSDTDIANALSIGVSTDLDQDTNVEEEV